MTSDLLSTPEQALAWIDAGKSVVLATVVQTWGSAPRPAGALMAISEEVELSGSVSGGCVENAVIEEALEIMQGGMPRILKFGVSDDNAFEAGLACGGEIQVMLTAIGGDQGLNPALLRELVAARAQHKAVALMTNIDTWRYRLAYIEDNALAARFASDKSGYEAEWFVGIHNPPLRLLIIGAVHIAQPLVQMARIAGFDVTVIDPREAFANNARFPDTKLVLEWPDAALLELNLDSRVAVVTLTHDPKMDDEALKLCMRSPIFYLGALGSVRTHAKRLARLSADGCTDTELARIHAPVGLKIGAKTPAEIALSVMAEITNVLRQGAVR